MTRIPISYSNGNPQIVPLRQRARRRKRRINWTYVQAWLIEQFLLTVGAAAFFLFVGGFLAGLWAIDQLLRMVLQP